MNEPAEAATIGASLKEGARGLDNSVAQAMLLLRQVFGEFTMRLILTSSLALTMSAGIAFAGGHCAAGKTLKDDVLTIATGNPAYYPWVMDDAPESKAGFEAAVAYAVGNRMGFEDAQIEWVRSSFDQAIQPGAKDFDFNLQQFSITEEREEIVDFSLPYYSFWLNTLPFCQKQPWEVSYCW